MRFRPSRTLALTAGLLVLTGVGPCDDDPILPEPGGEIIVAFDQPTGHWPRDGWALDQATLVDGDLELEIAYSGGCRTHELWLLAVDGFHVLPTAGPTPTVSVPIFLAHDAHDDLCEAWITRTERFGLDPLRAAFRDRFGDAPGRIILRVPQGQGSQDTTAVDLAVQ